MEVKDVAFMWMGKDGRIKYISNEDINKYKKVIVNSVITATVLIGKNTFAATTGGGSKDNSILEALKPLIDLIKDLAEPASYAYMAKGFLKIMQGKEEDGKKVIGYAAKGYLGVKFIPQIIKLIDKIDLTK